MDKEIFIVGLGFMGASIAGALKKKYPKIKIKGYDIAKKNIDYCLFAGIIDEGVTEEDFDNKPFSDDRIIIMCIPSAAIISFFRTHKNFLLNASLATDIGSVKKDIILNAESNSITNFVGSHPMCGSDKTGPENANFSLFRGKKCIVVREEANLTDKLKVEKIEQTADFWKALEMDVIFSTAEMHDDIAAYTSHLPHLVAFLLSDTTLAHILNINKGREKALYELTGFIGSGFKDSTRIASSSPELWSDIFLMNRENVVNSLDDFIISAKKLKAYIETGNKEALGSYINKISAERREIGI